MFDPGSADDAAERAMFRRYLDGLMTDEEFRDFETRLREDPPFRARYIRFADLEAGLALEIQRQQPGESRKTPPNSSSGWIQWGLPAALVLIALLYGWMTPPDQPKRVGAPPSRLESRALAAAIVTHVGDDVDAQDRKRLPLGARLKPGRLSLQRGQIDLDFFGGARLVLQGPAELEIESASSAFLASGKAAARIFEPQSRFVINTPDAACAELEAEIAMTVDPAARSYLRVLQGEVEVSLLGDDGATLVSERARQADSLVIQRGASEISRAPDALHQGLRVPSRPAPMLQVSQAYVSSVLSQNPLLYWRFDRQVGDLIPNEAGPESSGRILVQEDKLPGVVVAGGVARFVASPGQHCIMTDTPLQGLNEDSHSIECWVNPEKLHWGIIVGARLVGGNVDNSLCLLQTAYQTPYVHQPGAFNFMHRQPRLQHTGVNVYSPEGCTPGQWHHVVTVKSPEMLKLYVNGRLVRTLECQSGGDNDAFDIFLGALHHSDPRRRFVGLVDEFAVYPHELPEQVIRQHFEEALIVPAQDWRPLAERRLEEAGCLSL